MQANRLSVLVDSESQVDDGFDDVITSAERMAAKLNVTGERAGKNLGDGILRGADGRLRDASTGRFVAAGKTMGQNLITGSISSIVAGSPALTSALSGIGIGAAPLLGASVSAGIIGAVGAGGVIGAISLLSDDARIKSAGERLRERFLFTFRESALPAINPLLDAMSLVDDHIDGWGESLYGVFSNSTRNLDGFLRPVLDGVDNLIEAFAELTDQAIDPVMDSLGVGGKEVLDSFADGLRLLTDNGDEAADALLLLLVTSAKLIDVTFRVVDALSEAYRWMRIYSAFSAGDVAGAMRLVAQNEMEVAEGADTMSTSYHDASDAAEELTEKQNELNEAIYRAAELNISAAEAQINYTEKVKDATEAADKHSKVTDDERSALLDLARASNSLIQKLDEQGVSTNDLRKKTDQSRRDFIAAARQMGMNKKQAEQLADAYLAIPRRVHTTVSVSGIGSVSNAIGNALNNYQGRASGGPVGANIGHAAEGGSRGGLTLVGEMGPELVRLPYGSSVRTRGDSVRDIAQGMNGGLGGPVQVIISSRPGDPWKAFIDAMVPHLQYHVKRRGSGRAEYLAGG